MKLVQLIRFINFKGIVFDRLHQIDFQGANEIALDTFIQEDTPIFRKKIADEKDKNLFFLPY